MLDGKTQGFAFLEFDTPVRHAPPTATPPPRRRARIAAEVAGCALVGL